MQRAVLVAAVACAVLGGCGGGSDEEEIRAAVKHVVSTRTTDPERACEVMTARARAQLTVFVAERANEPCSRALARAAAATTDEDVEPAGVDRATVTIRGARAVVALGSDRASVGLVEVDGAWHVDDVLTPTLEPPRRPSGGGLDTGSDEQQVRATLLAFSRAVARDDYGRMCGLMSYGAEAQVVLAGAFAGLFGAGAGDRRRPSCAGALRELTSLQGFRAAVAELPSARQVARGRVAIRGDRATLRIPGVAEPQRFVREEGRWLGARDPDAFAADEGASPRELRSCWRRAGARIATSTDDLRFAAGRRATHVAVRSSHVSAKADDWRIFYALPESGDPGLAAVVARPSRVPAVAYVRDPVAHADVVNAARACGD